MKNKSASKLELYCQQLIITCQTQHTLHCRFNSRVVLCVVFLCFGWASLSLLRDVYCLNYSQWILVFKWAFDFLEDDTLSVFKMANLEIRQHSREYILMIAYIVLAPMEQFDPQVFHKLFVPVGLLLDIPENCSDAPEKHVRWNTGLGISAISFIWGKRWAERFSTFVLSQIRLKSFKIEATCEFGCSLRHCWHFVNSPPLHSWKKWKWKAAERPIALLQERGAYLHSDRLSISLLMKMLEFLIRQQAALRPFPQQSLGDVPILPANLDLC